MDKNDQLDPNTFFAAQQEAFLQKQRSGQHVAIPSTECVISLNYLTLSSSPLPSNGQPSPRTVPPIEIYGKHGGCEHQNVRQDRSE